MKAKDTIAKDLLRIVEICKELKNDYLNGAESQNRVVLKPIDGVPVKVHEIYGVDFNEKTKSYGLYRSEHICHASELNMRFGRYPINKKHKFQFSETMKDDHIIYNVCDNREGNHDHYDISILNDKLDGNSKYNTHNVFQFTNNELINCITRVFIRSGLTENIESKEPLSRHSIPSKIEDLEYSKGIINTNNGLSISVDGTGLVTELSYKHGEYEIESKVNENRQRIYDLYARDNKEFMSYTKIIYTPSTEVRIYKNEDYSEDHSIHYSEAQYNKYNNNTSPILEYISHYIDDDYDASFEYINSKKETYMSISFNNIFIHINKKYDVTWKYFSDELRDTKVSTIDKINTVRILESMRLIPSVSEYTNITMIPTTVTNRLQILDIIYASIVDKCIVGLMYRVGENELVYITGRRFESGEFRITYVTTDNDDNIIQDEREIGMVDFYELIGDECTTKEDR